jgi:hypothetical protein
LRRAGDEAQVTRAVHSALEAEPSAAGSFVALLLRKAPAEVPVRVEPPALSCRAEEVVDTGRLDLRFFDEAEWDVIVELKLYASYGRDQLQRYLDALRDVKHAYLVAITRDVPTYGEAYLAGEPRWLGSVRWRPLLLGLRDLPFTSDVLATHWRLFLDVLESEGSMGFTRPDANLFATLSTVRRAADHADDFLKALQQPLIEGLRHALGPHNLTADFYRAQRGIGRPVISKRWSGILDLQFRVPADSKVSSLRAGLFAYNPPTRFYVAPQHGRRLSARRQYLPESHRHAVEELVRLGFRDYDLHAFYDLTEERLASPTLEEDIVRWAHDRFAELAQSGLLQAQHLLKGASFAVSGEDEEQDA